MCCLPSDPSEPWTTTFSAFVTMAFLGVVCITTESMIVSVPGAPEQGLSSARDSVWVKWMVVVWAAKAAVGASSAADSVRAVERRAAVVGSSWTSLYWPVLGSRRHAVRSGPGNAWSRAGWTFVCLPAW